MKDIEALIAGAKKAIEQVEPEDVEILLGEDLVQIRFWPVSGQEWRGLVASHPARLEKDADGKSVIAQQDRAHGFNVDSLTRAYPRVALVDDDGEKPLDGTLWGRILDVLDGPGFEGIAATIFFLNVIIPSQRTAAAGKASRGGAKRKRVSPASSGSRSGS